MHPAYFALVMATGIVSIGCRLFALELISFALFALNLIFYAVIWSLLIARILRHRDRVAADLFHHGRSVGFFTAVAATSVLGSQCLIVVEWLQAAIVLWAFAIGLWALITYAIFTIITVKEDKPALAEGINGAWLVAVVAAQSVAVLGAQLAPKLGHPEHVLLFCTAMWLGGGMLYLWIIGMIFYRYTFFVMSPADLAPPYWINMGAAAISTLAGSMLAAARAHSTVIVELLPFIRGWTLMWWATATWWIPMLLILGVWRHGYRKFPLRYDPLYWGAVFPLGMYTVCTLRLSQVIDAPYLIAIPRVFVYVALAAWSITAFGMIRQILSTGLRAMFGTHDAP
jgi:tellurite resistance protein TehA-like permease